MDAESVFVVLSGSGRAAVATVLVAGPRAEQAVSQHFRSEYVSRRAMLVNRIHVGTWECHGRGEELVVCRVATDQFEIHCHGGRMAATKIADSLTEIGLRRISSEAWLARTPGSTSVELARALLPGSPTLRTTAILLDQLRGAMSRELGELKSLIRAGDQPAAEQRVAALIARADIGRHLVSRWSIVITGRPNAGKSSLINRLLGYQRAVVFDQPGTTRDVISVEAAFDGWPATITDTAGIRASDDRIEREGIRLAKEKIEQADLVIQLEDLSDVQVFSGTLPVPLGDGQRRLVVGTKSDLVDASTRAAACFDSATSALTGEGVAELVELIAKTLVPDPPPLGAAIPLSPGQVEMLELVRQRLADDQLASAAELIDQLN